MSAPAEQTRDVIVVGASLGGVPALKRLVAELPADLPALLEDLAPDEHDAA